MKERNVDCSSSGACCAGVCMGRSFVCVATHPHSLFLALLAARSAVKFFSPWVRRFHLHTVSGILLHFYFWPYGRFCFLWHVARLGFRAVAATGRYIRIHGRLWGAKCLAFLHVISSLSWSVERLAKISGRIKFICIVSRLIGKYLKRFFF